MWLLHEYKLHKWCTQRLHQLVDTVIHREMRLTFCEQALVAPVAILMHCILSCADKHASYIKKKRLIELDFMCIQQCLSRNASATIFA